MAELQPIKPRVRVRGHRSVVDFFQGIKFNRHTWVLLLSKATNGGESQGWPDQQRQRRAAVGQ